MTLLDRPVWSSLTTAHLVLGEGDDLARRYRPDINFFGAARDEDAESLEQLSALVAPGGQLYMLEAAPMAAPKQLRPVLQAMAVQMRDTGAVAADAAPGPDAIVPLGDADAPEMLALATLTQPGPFLPRTHVMGAFWGVRREGRLVAMAGERMCFPGYREVSAVCAHPDVRGQGLARRLTLHATAAIRARGETPFLHSWADNIATISLYETLGFELRSAMHVTVLGRN